MSDTEPSGSERRLSDVSEGALIKATQATDNAIGSTAYAHKMLGSGTEYDTEGAFGAIQDALELLEYASIQIEDEWNARTLDTDRSRMESEG